MNNDQGGNHEGLTYSNQEGGNLFKLHVGQWCLEGNVRLLHSLSDVALYLCGGR